jgi:hypothetical protein
MQCRACLAEMLETSRFCPSCGAAIANSETPTVTSAPARPRPPSTDSIDHARFVPGTMLAGRYRIVALIGRGGMGEVYRAEDLRLGQPVALKFLPEDVAHDADRLARFDQEVRVARQVSHPNVCRVYDVGEADGQHFLSMEYVDGEDLASLLRRIGRLPAGKATEIARQLCAGLAAAHDRGVLHRDLKPANVLIDGRGRARIADFGLAGLVEDGRDRDVIIGTPGYMAPEQYAGQATSTRSDIYALGLVLYELFTGKPALAASHGNRVAGLADRTDLMSPSSLVADIDPAVERVILRCLERDPARRPSSAIAVAAALPGGDPLAAALAAGETPSPEAVAAAGNADIISTRAVVVCLALIVAGLVLTTVLAAKTSVLQKTPFEKSPAALEQKARDLIQSLGYAEPPTDRAHGFVYDIEFQQHAERQEQPSTYRAQLASGQPSPISFWYRQSPRYLEVVNGVGAVSFSNPPPVISGMVRVSLDPQGRLVQFDAVPPQVEDVSARSSQPVDWAAPLAAAGLDMARFAPAEPKWLPLTGFDARAAWTGSFAHAPDVPMRVEAASWRGKPVYFQVIGPWSRPARMQPYQRTRGQRAAQWLVLCILGAVFSIAVLLAWRNFSQRRGDIRGASRLAAFVFGCAMLVWLCTSNHVPTTAELASVLWAISSALFSAATFWALYVALEPHVRRLWPQSMITWSRLLGGGVRDSLVGGHLLIGVAFGVAYTILFAVPPLLGAREVSAAVNLSSVVDARRMIGVFVSQLTSSIATAMGIFLLFFLLRALLRRQWLAAVVFILLLAASGFGTDHPLIRVPVFGVQFALAIFILIRFGVLPMMVGIFVSSILPSFPLTTDFSTWYAGSTLFALASVLALTAYAFHTAIAGRPVFKESFLEAT